MVKRGWLLSEEHSTLHKRGHLSLHQLLSDSCAGKRQAIEKHDEQNRSTVGQLDQAKDLPLQPEEEPEEDGGVRGGDG